MSKHKIMTSCVHAGTIIDKKSQGSNTPIHTSTSYGYLDIEDVVYPRYFNIPNAESLGIKISELEHGEAGLIFSSGMAAVSTILFTFLHNGDHAIFQKGLYLSLIHI